MRFVNIKNIILVIIALILLFIIKNIIYSIISINQNSRIVTDLKDQEKAERQKRQFLKEQLYYVNTPQFIEQQAREKLGMVKPGEHIVLVPSITEDKPESKTLDNEPNWKKWWNLFF